MIDLQPSTYIILFMFFGLALMGLAGLVIAVYIGVQRILTPIDPDPAKTRWEKDWQDIERNLSE